MSKTTIALLLIFFLLLSGLFFILTRSPQDALKTLTQETSAPSMPKTTLSLIPSSQTIAPGQTATVAVVVTQPNPQTEVVQLEIGYDPMSITIEKISPGTFFTSPVVSLNKISPTTGRISYALRCDSQQSSSTSCINPTARTFATITFRRNPLSLTKTTKFSFLPKTTIRDVSGNRILQQTNNLQLTFTKKLP